jgi:hypothetical protein
MLAMLDAGVLSALRKWVEEAVPVMNTDDVTKTLLVNICNSMSKLPVTEDHIRQSRIGHALRELAGGPPAVAAASSHAREEFKRKLNILSSASGARVQVSTDPTAAAAAAAPATAGALLRTSAPPRQGSDGAVAASDASGKDDRVVATGAEDGEESSESAQEQDAQGEAATEEASGAVEGEEVDSMAATNGAYVSELCLYSVACWQLFLQSAPCKGDSTTQHGCIN